MTTELWAVGLAILSTVIGAFGPILFKKASKTFTIDPRKILRKPLTLLKNYYLVSGCTLYAASAFVFIFALRGGELSVLYPIGSLVYVWVAFLSVKLLNEKLGFAKLAGIICIIIGVSLIGFGNV